MADTLRSDFPDRYCANCGSKGCHIKHWGPLMGYKMVYLDNCVIDMKEGTKPKYDCNTGKEIKE